MKNLKYKNYPEILSNRVKKLAIFVIMSLLCYDLKASERSAAGTVSVYFGVSESNTKFEVLIENSTEAEIHFSSLGIFENHIYLMDSTGEIQIDSISKKLGPDFIYKPDFSLGANQFLLFKGEELSKFTSGLRRAIEREYKPGKYEVWFDVVDYVTFKAGISNKYTSNKVIMYVGKDGNKTFVNDPVAVSELKEHGIGVGNSADEVEVELTADGNYRVTEMTPGYPVKNKRNKQYTILIWIASGAALIVVGWLAWKRTTKRKLA